MLEGIGRAPLPPIERPPGTGVRRAFCACLALRSTACICDSSARTSASEGAPAAIASLAFLGVAAAAWCTDAGAGKLAASCGSATSLSVPDRELPLTLAPDAPVASCAPVAPWLVALPGAPAPSCAPTAVDDGELPATRLPAAVAACGGVRACPVPTFASPQAASAAAASRHADEANVLRPRPMRLG